MLITYEIMNIGISWHTRMVIPFLSVVHGVTIPVFYQYPMFGVVKNLECQFHSRPLFCIDWYEWSFQEDVWVIYGKLV